MYLTIWTQHTESTHDATISIIWHTINKRFIQFQHCPSVVKDDNRLLKTTIANILMVTRKLMPILLRVEFIEQWNESLRYPFQSNRIKCPFHLWTMATNKTDETKKTRFSLSSLLASTLHSIGMCKYLGSIALLGSLYTFPFFSRYSSDCDGVFSLHFAVAHFSVSSDECNIIECWNGFDHSKWLFSSTFISSRLSYLFTTDLIELKKKLHKFFFCQRI